MSYSIGDNVGTYTNLHWQSDWSYDEILGEDYAKNGNGVLGLYSDSKFKNVCYYVDYELGLIVCKIKDDEENMDVYSEEWSEEFLCHLLSVQQ